MSYILDALKRAEHERGSSLNGASAGPDGSPVAPMRPLTLAMAGATIFLAGIGVAALLFRSPAPGATARQASAAPQTLPMATPQATVAPRTEPSRTPDATPAAADALVLQGIESLDDLTPVFQGSATATAPAPEATTAPATTPWPESTAARPATAASPSAGLPPQLDGMPADFRARFPQIQVQVHVHDEDPAKRWVMIDNRRYSEGSVLESGPRIEEITADGVIFEFSGQRTFWPLAR